MVGHCMGTTELGRGKEATGSERRTLTLHNEEKNDQTADQVASGEDVAVTEVDGASDEGSEEGEQEIPELFIR